MARCVRCDRKIGWLRRAVDGCYCSTACRRASHLDELERLRAEAAQRGAEEDGFSRGLAVDPEERSRIRVKLELEAAVLRAKAEIARREAEEGPRCPKCGAGWSERRGAGAQGRDHGACGACGFAAEFVAIEQCPNCGCGSLVVESEDDARCPRCKSRPRRRRQIA
jgi:hypothetical protein